MDEKKSGFLSRFKWFQKLRGVKHIEIILVVVVALVVLLIWFGNFGGSGKKDSSSANIELTSTAAYARELETKLQNVLGDISGAGEVSVMITLDGSAERILAYTEDSKNNSTNNTTSGGGSSSTTTTTTSSSPVIITQNGVSTPLVLSEKMPPVKGVVVVAKGAGDVRVKLDILRAVQALLSVSSSQIEIFVKN